MSGSAEKSIEILVGDLGELLITLRPELPFLAEGVRIRKVRHVAEIFGAGRRVSIEVGEDVWPALAQSEQVLLMEFRGTEADAFRELFLQVETA
jgi:hypothetical protein